MVVRPLIALSILLSLVSVATPWAHAETAFSKSVTIGQKKIGIEKATYSDRSVLKIGNFELDTSDTKSVEKLTHWKPMDYDALLYSAQYIDEFLRDNRAALLKLVDTYVAEKKYGKEYYDKAFALMLDEGYLSYFSETYPGIAANEKPLREAVDSGKFPRPIDKVKTWDKPLTQNSLLVTHASDRYDPQGCIQSNINDLVTQFKQFELPVIYLMAQDSMQDFTYYLKDRKPTIALESQGGEHTLKISSSELTITGGYFTQCMFETLRDAVQSYFRENPNPEPLKLNLPLGSMFNSYDMIMVPSRLGGGSSSRAKFRSMDAMMKAMGKDAFLKYVDAAFTQETPEIQRNGDVGPFDPKEYSFDVYIDGKKETTFGSGKRRIDLRFWTPENNSWIKQPAMPI